MQIRFIFIVLIEYFLLNSFDFVCVWLVTDFFKTDSLLCLWDYNLKQFSCQFQKQNSFWGPHYYVLRCSYIIWCILKNFTQRKVFLIFCVSWHCILDVIKSMSNSRHLLSHRLRLVVGSSINFIKSKNSQICVLQFLYPFILKERYTLAERWWHLPFFNPST